MNAPPWLPNILAVVMLVLAAYSGWRMVMARFGNLPTDYEADAMHALAGLALAELLVHWMDVLPRGVWTALFIAAAAWFAGRALYSVRDRAEAVAQADTAADVGGSDGTGTGVTANTAAGRRVLLPPQAKRLLAYAAASLIMVYMFLAGVAPSTLSGSTAGEYTMAGMPDMIKDTTISYPSLGLLLTAVMAGYAVVSVDRITPASAPLSTSPQLSSPHIPPPLHALVFAPRTVECCRVLLCITTAYAILAKIV